MNQELSGSRRLAEQFFGRIDLRRKRLGKAKVLPGNAAQA
jgi:hypothetical protein